MAKQSMGRTWNIRELTGMMKEVSGECKKEVKCGQLAENFTGRLNIRSRHVSGQY